MTFWRNNIVPILLFVVLLISIPLTVRLGQTVQRYVSEAQAVPANIIVTASVTQGILPRPWEGYSQGGELDFGNRTLVSVTPEVPKLSGLNTRFVRFDHMLDMPYYSRIPEVRAAAAAGMTPVISLSYFPTSVAATDISYPYNWANWRSAVANLVTQISGRNGLNLTGVYYEVWNEPDGSGFGGWTIGGYKDYMRLYTETLQGISQGTNLNPFKVGGPALANPDDTAWLSAFINQIDQRNLRLDFLSWHRYNRDPAVFRKDLENEETFLAGHPKLIGVEKIISEWGSDPSANYVHDSNYDAAHFIAVLRTILGRVNFATKFEVRDGAYGAETAQGLGIFTYHGYPKPIAQAAAMLTRVTGERVMLEGEGSNVSGFAAKDGDNLSVILTNFDQQGFHTEEVPITVRDLTPGTYLLRKTIIDGYNQRGRLENSFIDLPGGSLYFRQPMLANSVILLEFIKQ